MVREMPVDIEGEPFDPGGVVHVGSGEEGSVDFVPVLGVFPARDGGVAVVEVGEGG